jgi:phytanoyl-CoA hydroxylase
MDIKQFYDEEGYVIVRSLVNNDVIEKVLTDFEKAKKTKAEYYSQSTHEWIPLNNVTKHGFLRESIQTPTKQWSLGQLRKSVREVVAEKKISDSLKILSGGYKYFVNWQNMLFDRSTGTVDHADSWYLDTSPCGLMIAAWIALEDIHEKCGRFFIIPKSHKMEKHINEGSRIEEHNKYAETIHLLIRNEGLKRYAPSLKKGDVLFWHPNTIHGSYSQEDEEQSRKSITAHYHPVGIGRKSQEGVKALGEIIKKMEPTHNSCIYLDNYDPSTYDFYWKNKIKHTLKRCIFGTSSKGKMIMDRERMGLDIKGS